MKELNAVIAKNLTTLRKKAQLTQMQLAEKLNYSDKAVSKWEKGDCVPNVYVLVTLADFYDVKVQDIVYESKTIQPWRARKGFRVILSGLSAMLVWLVATIVYVVLNYIPGVENEYLAFMVASPIFFLVLTIFSSFWKWKVASGVFASLFVWTLITMVGFVFQEYQIWLVYIVGAPLQIIIVLALLLDYLKHRVKE